MSPHRIFLVILTIATVAAPVGADAQQPPKVPRVGFLSPSSASAAGRNLEAFRQGLRDLG